MEYKGKHDIYDGPKEGLFGQTDRSTGEYHFRSGRVEQIYSDARYIPADECCPPTRYYRSAESEARRRKKTGFGFFAVLTLCLACAILGGVFGAVLMSGYVNQPSDTRSINSDAAAPREETEFVNTEAETLTSNGQAPSNGGGRSLSADTISNVYTPGEIYNIACEQTVVINTEYAYRAGGVYMPSVVSGSGFVISDDGLILTNYHVVEKAVNEGCVPVVSFSDGSSYDATVVGYSAVNDVAVLKINREGLTPATLGDSDAISVGDTIFVVGDPQGVLDFTQTTGHICALNRKVATETNEQGIDMFQIDAAVYNGNSGGPVYNENGEVIGIVTAKYGDGESGGIGFAIPMNDVVSILNEKLFTGEGKEIRTSSKASMGITFDCFYSDFAMNYFGMPEGACVGSVEYAGPGYLAGIEPGDIMTQIGESSIADYSDVEKILSQYRPGDRTVIHIWRDGQMYTTNLTFDAVQ